MDPTLYAATSKAAGRINASVISEDEHNGLLHERQKLLDKKFEGSATRKELNRLEYVRWSLDRIEDAKHGAGLEQLELLVATYEKLHTDIIQLTENLDTYNPSKSRTGRNE